MNEENQTTKVKKSGKAKKNYYCCCCSNCYISNCYWNPNCNRKIRA